LKFPFYDPIIYEFVNVSIPLNNLESFAHDVEEFLYEKFMETVVQREEHEDDDDYYEREDEDEDEDDPFIRSINSFSYFQGSRHRYSVEFPSIMRTSLFLSCYSFLENHLITICKEIQRKKKLELGVGDLKHNGIEKAQVYLKKVAGLNFPEQSPEWNYIKKCNKIRNCIVHNGSLIDENNKNLRDIIKSMNTIRTDNFILEEKIRLEKGFCFDFIQNMRTLLNDISQEYQEIFKFTVN
jgi:hypothetical protein